MLGDDLCAVSWRARPGSFVGLMTLYESNYIRLGWLVGDLRAFERTIGFVATKNFLTLTGERDSFPFCGQASRYTLPYSYEDPSIRWVDSLDEVQCHAVGSDADVFFGTVEAMGEIGTPVTPYSRDFCQSASTAALKVRFSRTSLAMASSRLRSRAISRSTWGSPTFLPSAK